MNRISISEVTGKVQLLPPLPAAVQKLLHLTKDMEVNTEEVAQVVSTDEVLTGRILRVANSAAYGLSQKVSTISQAMVVLGLDGIRSLAIGVTLMNYQAGKGATPSLKREDLWHHAFAAASAAQLMASHFQYENWEEAFVGGMLHDIGKIVLAECFPKQYELALQQAAEGRLPLHMTENNIFGIHHAALGAEICRQWRMPDHLVQMVGQNQLSTQPDFPSNGHNRMCHAVRLGDGMAKLARIGLDGDPNIAADFLQIIEKEHLSLKQIRHLIRRLGEEMRKVEAFFMFEKTSVPNPEGEGMDSIGVWVADPRDHEVLEMALLAMGFQLASAAEMEGRQQPLAAVVHDDSLKTKLREVFAQQGVKLLDFGDWRKQHTSPEKFIQLNILKLDAWLLKNLKN
ncbi:MAG: HDOD domain-containing protein [Verrucomicrobiae bacterium]|nr:HDOD domain-containing protein [Verrucomicrobiae bacterium]